MNASRKALEDALNDFDPRRRREALEALLDLVKRGLIEFRETRDIVNIHAHTFFSYNGYGYSPTGFAWKARCEGLRVAGIIDFDVLDGVDEFLEACRLIGIRGCASIETRVFIPQFSTREMSSPGEPGITYMIGTGFTRTAVDDPLLPELKETAQGRNRDLLGRVNPFLKPGEIDYERDVLPLTPSGNPTERHICAAYDMKAREIFPDPNARAEFWAGKLGGDPQRIKAMFDAPAALQALIRSKTMKAGGVGYIQPEGPMFPGLDRFCAFVRKAGAIPVYGWLNGLAQGEQDIDELLDLMISAGAAAIDLIPDRCWNVKDPEEKKRKLVELYKIARISQERGMPFVCGTEMNAPGMPFVDNFAAPEMQPVAGILVKDALIMYAHTRLEAEKGIGYLSDWAATQFASVEEKNAFFLKVGETLEPQDAAALATVRPAMTPGRILEALGRSRAK